MLHTPGLSGNVSALEDIMFFASNVLMCFYHEDSTFYDYICTAVIDCLTLYYDVALLTILCLRCTLITIGILL